MDSLNKVIEPSYSTNRENDLSGAKSTYKLSLLASVVASVAAVALFVSLPCILSFVLGSVILVFAYDVYVMASNASKIVRTVVDLAQDNLVEEVAGSGKKEFLEEEGLTSPELELEKEAAFEPLPVDFEEEFDSKELLRQDYQDSVIKNTLLVQHIVRLGKKLSV